jgi:hypothetical protein
MKKLLAATALALCFSATQPALAMSDGDRPSKEEFKKMTPEEKKAFHEKKEAEWKKLSKSEKIKVIEERRTERLKRMDEKWSKMSDDEKIKFVEERHEKRKERFKKFHDDESGK